MTLDEAIARERQLAKEQRSHIGTWDDEYSKKCEVYAEEHEQRAQWLEELKNNRIALEKANGYLEANHKLGYDKGVDDFVKASRDVVYNYYTEQAYIKYDDFCKIAEQLKNSN